MLISTESLYSGQDEFGQAPAAVLHQCWRLLALLQCGKSLSYPECEEKWIPEIRRHCRGLRYCWWALRLTAARCQSAHPTGPVQERPVDPQEACVCAEEVQAVSYMECSSLTRRTWRRCWHGYSGQHSVLGQPSQQKRLKKRTPDKWGSSPSPGWKKYCCFGVDVRIWLHTIDMNAVRLELAFLDRNRHISICLWDCVSGLTGAHVAV